MQNRIGTAVLGVFALLGLVPGGAFGFYQQTNLITSATDPDLINPWGTSFSATSPFWVSDNGTGKATLYNAAGVKQGLIVSMPAADPITGQVFNGTASFNGDTFLFASENGHIDGWRGALGTNAEQLSSVASAVYKGLAITNAKNTIYAANFNSGAIDKFTGPGAPDRQLHRSNPSCWLRTVQHPEYRRCFLRHLRAAGWSETRRRRRRRPWLCR